MFAVGGAWLDFGAFPRDPRTVDHTTPPIDAALSRHRLEGLSDGVFAVVLTLLVLELKPEHLPARASDAEIWAALSELSRPLLGYAITFALTGSFWVLQHRKFTLISHSTLRHTWLTLLFLFFVSLLPFSVSMWMRNIGHVPGLILYFGNMMLVATSLLIGWLDAQWSGLVIEMPRAKRRALTFRMASMAVGCAAAVAVTVFNAPEYAPIALLLAVGVTRVLTRRLAS